MKGGDATSATLNLVELVKEGFLYGGYYSAYGGATITDVTGARGLTYNAAGTYTSEALSKEDAGSTKYNPTKAKYWDINKAYTDVKGSEMNPQPDNVYYLKEVPDGYIRPYIHFTYDTIAEGMPIKKLWIITATDDTNYNAVGYFNNASPTNGTKTMLLTIKLADGTVDAKLTAKSVFSAKYPTVTRGYLYYVDASSLIGQDSFQYVPYWETPDGELIKGRTTRTINSITTKTAISVTDA